MARKGFRWVAGLLFVLALAAPAIAQGSGEKPLGDVAREARQSRRPASGPKKIYSNDVIGTGQTGPQAVQFATSEEGSPEAQPSSTPEDGRSPVLDSPRDELPDDFIVPAGTVIRIDPLDRKVSVPVRVGFATPIPALSKVVLKTEYVCGYPGYAYQPYSYYDSCWPTYRLTHVILDGKSYPVQSTPTGQSNADMAFTLDEPLALPR